jgi:hypothetical protein
MLLWDRLFLGGGNAVKLRPAHVSALGPGVTVVSNDVGIIGGVKAWDIMHLRAAPAGAIGGEPPQVIDDLIETLLEKGEDPDVA